MKKILILFALLMMSVSMTACQKKVEEEVVIEPEIEPVIEHVININAINNILETKIVKVFDDAENEHCFVIDKEVGVYEFDYKDHYFMARTSLGLYKDLTGFYEEESEIIADAPVFFVGEESYATRFSYDDIQYSLTVNKGDDMSLQDFEAIIENWIDRLSDDMSEDLKDLCGQYYENGGKGSMYVYPKTRNTINLTVSMPLNDDEYSVWSMNARLSGTKLIYDGLSHFVENPEKGESLQIPDDTYGFFSIDDKNINWDGSGNTETSGYIFHR